MPEPSTIARPLDAESVPNGPDTVAWQDVENILTEDDNNAYAVIPAGYTTEWLRIYNLNLDQYIPPECWLAGVRVAVRAKQDVYNADGAKFLSSSLYTSGPVGDDVFTSQYDPDPPGAPVLPDSWTNYIFGWSVCTWGDILMTDGNLFPADLRTEDFGYALRCEAGTAGGTARVAWIKLWVYWRDWNRRLRVSRPHILRRLGDLLFTLP